MPSEILSLFDFSERLGRLYSEMDDDSIKKYRKMIETQNTIVCIANHQSGEMIFQESKYISLFKFEMNNKLLDLYSFINLVDKNDKEIYLNFLTEIKNNKPFKGKIKLLLGNLGKTRLLFEINSFPFKENRVLLYFLNITESITAQRKLLEHEIHYFKMLDLSPFGVAVHDGGTVIYVNKQAVKILGADSSEELVGRIILDFIHPDYLQIVKKRSQTIIEERKDVNILEEKFLRVDGKVIDVEVLGTTTYYQGRVLAQVLFRDITEKKSFEKEIFFNERRFRTVFQNSPFIEMIFDDHFIVKDTNNMCHTFFIENNLDQNSTNFLDLLDEKTSQQLMQLSSTSSLLKKNEISLELPNHPICNFTVIRLDTEITEYFVLMEDVTNLLKMKKELEVREKITNLGLLSSGLSHDFNNLLTSSLGYIELLKTGFSDLPEEVKTIIQEIERTNLRGKDLIKKLQGLVGDRKEELRNVNLKTVIEEVQKIVFPRLGDISLIISKKDEDPMILATFNDIFQIILNLVVNAIDALSKKEGEKWIEISYIVRENCLLLSVSDNGKGMSPEIQKEIFHPFFSTKSSLNESRGLGLVTVQSIVSRLRGQIQVRSELGRGTTMLVNLPLSTEAKCYLQ